jgi:hypothetical protein
LYVSSVLQRDNLDKTTFDGLEHCFPTVKQCVAIVVNSMIEIRYDLKLTSGNSFDLRCLSNDLHIDVCDWIESTDVSEMYRWIFSHAIWLFDSSMFYAINKKNTWEFRVHKNNSDTIDSLTICLLVELNHVLWTCKHNTSSPFYTWHLSRKEHVK